MILNSPNWNKFRDFFKTHHELEQVCSAMNKDTNGIMGKKIYSNDTKKTQRVINVYEQGNGFRSRYYAMWIEDLSTDLKFWSLERLKYGWKHPRMMVPVSIMEEKFEKGSLEVIELEWEDKLKDKDYGKED